MITVGFIGLGSQGAPMAERIIAAGFPVWLWARRAETLAPFSAANVQFAPSVEELAFACDLVGICVVDDDGVREMCARIIPAMRPGGIIVIHATIHPDSCIALGQQAAAHGLSLIDAPVSGGGGAAAAGTLTVMAGGNDAAIAAARPVFASFASHIVHLGDIGSGQMAKLVNNTLMAANLALAHHALEAGGALGIERAALIELIKLSTGRSFSFDVYARMPEPRAFAHGARLLAKDVGLLCDVLHNHDSAAVMRATATPFLDLALTPPVTPERT
jgi:3-hydroxyisobutyrate dehydrogenase-like beta-hydroxyacid dehydrogenase